MVSHSYFLKIRDSGTHSLALPTLAGVAFVLLDELLHLGGISRTEADGIQNDVPAVALEGPQKYPFQWFDLPEMAVWRSSGRTADILRGHCFCRCSRFRSRKAMSIRPRRYCIRQAQYDGFSLFYSLFLWRSLDRLWVMMVTDSAKYCGHWARIS